jgi:photosystem II stability/assembly factor-like uncharacterized protein
MRLSNLNYEKRSLNQRETIKLKTCRICLYILLFNIIDGLLIPAQTQTNLWKHSNGPYGGFVSTILIDGGKVFAGGYGGIFISANDGLNWRHVGPYVGPVTSIASSNSYIFASTSSDGIYRSADRGETWANTSDGLTSFRINKVCVLDTIIFAGTAGYGIFRSLDYGKSWSAANNGIDNLSIRNLCTIGNVIIASSAGASGSGMFRSTDGGQSWSRLELDPYGWHAECITSYDNILYGADFQNQAKIYSSADSGKSWILPDGATAPDDIIDAIYAGYDGLFAGTYSHGIFGSRDRTGSSWQSLNKGISNKIITAITGNSNYIYAGTWSGINRSSNSGNLWSYANSGLNNSIVSSLIAIGDKIFAGTWGSGIMISADGGLSWQGSKSPDPYIYEICNFNGTLFALAGVYPSAWNGGITFFVSKDSGRSWSPWGNSLSYLPTCLAANNSFIFTNNQDGIFRTDYSGKSWVKVLSGSGQDRRSIVALDSIILVVQGDEIFRSSDNGQTWTPVLAGPYGLLSRLFVVENQVYAGGNQINEMYVSNDKGVTWQRLNVPHFNCAVEQIVGSGSFVAAGLSRGAGVIVSYDSGNNWINYNLNLSNCTVQSLLLLGSKLYAGTWGNGVYFTEPGITQPLRSDLVFPETGSTNISTRALLAWNAIQGASRYQIQLSKSAIFDTIIIDEPSLLEPSIFISTLDYSTTYYWRVRGQAINGYTSSWINSWFSTRRRPEHISLYQNYPNPFNSNTQIKFDLPNRTMVTIRIFNSLGQLIEILRSDYFPDGYNVVTWNAKQYSSGVYYINLQANNFNETKKIILLK